MRHITVLAAILCVLLMLIESKALGQQSSVPLDVKSLQGIGEVQVVIDLSDTAKYQNWTSTRSEPMLNSNCERLGCTSYRNRKQPRLSEVRTSI